MDEVFGSPAQCRMQLLGERLLGLLADDPRFCSHGRGVQVVNHDTQAADLVDCIARLIGASACELVPKTDVASFRAELESRGLKTDVIAHYLSAPDVLAKARDVVSLKPLPADLSVRLIDGSAPRALLEAFAEVAMPHGVLPPIGSVMRGVSRPGFAMVAFDRAGRPVATAGSVRSRHRDHPGAGTVQWGQLATIPERQGEGIARTLGAMAMLHAAEHIGATRFRTGISTGNTASARLCASLAVHDSDVAIVAGMDPATFDGDKLTR